MTNYTRRAFIKRAGSASLGTALGLGLIPSVTSKLKAADTSGGIQGVVMQVTSASTAATSTANLLNAQNEIIGTVSAGVSFSHVGTTPGVCCAQIVVSWYRWCTWTPTGGTALPRREQRWTTTWTCVDGVATPEKQLVTTTPGFTGVNITDASGTALGPALEPIAAAGTAYNASSVSAGIYNGTTPVAGSTATAGPISHSVTCCPLSA